MNPWVAGLIGAMIFIAGFLSGQTYEIKAYTRWLRALDKSMPNYFPYWREYLRDFNEHK